MCARIIAVNIHLFFSFHLRRVLLKNGNDSFFWLMVAIDRSKKKDAGRSLVESAVDSRQGAGCLTKPNDMKNRISHGSVEALVLSLSSQSSYNEYASDNWYLLTNDNGFLLFRFNSRIRSSWAHLLPRTNRLWQSNSRSSINCLAYGSNKWIEGSASLGWTLRRFLRRYGLRNSSFRWRSNAGLPGERGPSSERRSHVHFPIRTGNHSKAVEPSQRHREGWCWIDFHWMFSYEKGLNWHTVFENELNLPFDNSNLTRWILLDGHILIMSFHHVLVDAKNLFYIGQRYLALCLTTCDDRKPIAHLEPMEKYLFNKYSFEPISDLDLKSRPGRPEPIVSRTHVRHFYVSDPILSRLQEQCHRHQIRLNSILTVVSATGYHLACHVSSEQKLKIHMMVNIRSQLDLDYKSTGMFATVFDCFLLLDPHCVSSLWPNAKQQHDDLHRRINEKEYIANCKNDTDLLRMINSDESFSSDDVHFAFSNLGLLSKTNENQLEEHYFGVSLIEQRWTSSILLGISTIEKRLCFTITYNKNIVSEAFVDEWIEKIYYVLERI